METHTPWRSASGANPAAQHHPALRLRPSPSPKSDFHNSDLTWNFARIRGPKAVPWCCLTENYVQLLEEAATIHAGEDSTVRRALSEKIRGSVLKLREEIPPGYVKLGSRVTFRVNDQITLSRVLVHWDRFLVPGLHLSLATPWGIALLGTRVGHEAPVHWRDGSVEMIKVEAVEEPTEPSRVVVRNLSRLDA